MASTITPKQILTVNLSQHLHSVPVSQVLSSKWSAAPPSTSARFENEGYNLDPKDVPRTVEGLQRVLREKEWDGVVFGWCVRGGVEFTELFEKVVQLAVEETRERRGVKLIFNDGPEGLVGAVVRNFPEDV